MPKEGFDSITIRESTYDEFLARYIRDAEKLRLAGINSLSGFITAMLHALLSDKETYNTVIENMAKKTQETLLELRKK